MNAAPEVANDPLDRWSTFREAMAQPDIWRRWATELEPLAKSVSQWIQAGGYEEIWLCGAGTSAFIGETLSAYLNATLRRPRYRAVSTTDLVSCPTNYIGGRPRLLVLSFGRSGDSPETIGTLDLLDTHLPDADRLHFTCNPDGALARRPARGPGQQRVVLLPSRTNDSGFAMTSSYSTMLLSALSCLDDNPPLPVGAAFDQLSDRAQRVLDRSLSLARATMQRPSRAVFLGCGALTGSARECALKVLELTRGYVPTTWDSTLGFRHGPKAIMDENTRVYVLVSGDPHTRRYDLDAVNEIRQQFGASSVATLGDGQDMDVDIPLIGNDAWTSVLYVVAIQVQAIAWSDRLSINVDNPFTEGNLSRVVTGVSLYPLEVAQ
jgi:fructoselysine-6-P-deglycase FrlB-like protein